MCLAARSEAGKYGSEVKSVEIYYYFSVEEEEKKIEGMLIMRRNCTGEWNTMKVMTVLKKQCLIKVENNSVFNDVLSCQKWGLGGGGGDPFMIETTRFVSIMWTD